MSTLTPEKIFAAVEDKRQQLLNVLGVVQCMKIATRFEPPTELEGAVCLVEDQLQNILEGLEEMVLTRTIEAEAATEEVRP